MTRFTHCKLLLSRNNSLTLASAKAHTATEKKQITRYRLAKIKSPLPSVASKAETPERLAIHALGLSHCRACHWRIPISGSPWWLEQAAAMFVPAVVVDVHDITAVRIYRGRSVC